MQIKNIIRDALVRDNQSGKQVRTIIIKKKHLQMPPSEQNPSSLEASPRRPTFRMHPRSKSENRGSQPNQISPTNRLSPPSDYQNSKDLSVRINLVTQRKTSRKKVKSLPNKLINKTSDKKLDKRIPQIEKSLKSYLEFIRAAVDQKYRISVNLDKLRVRGRCGITSEDKCTLQFYNCIYENLYESLSAPSAASCEQISASCFSYFESQKKAKIQILLSARYPKLLHSRLRPYLVYQRIIIYALLVLCRSHMLQKMHAPQVESLRMLVKYTKECLEALAEPLLQIEREVVNKITETFIILKAVGQMQKKLAIIERELQSFFRSSKSLTDIQDSFLQFTASNALWTLESLSSKQMELSWKYLKLPPVPNLPSPPAKPFSLVIELNNTLVYYDAANKTLKYRPYIDIFLTKLKDFFEIVLFSSISYQYTRTIVNQIEKVGRYFDFCLCANHLVHRNGKLTKDYDRLGRDEEKAIIVDFVDPIEKKWSKNFIKVPEWQGDKSDRWLYKLVDLLSDLGSQKPNDVRTYLRELNIQLQMIDEQQEDEQDKYVL